MPWQDDPVIEQSATPAKAPSWQDDPVVGEVAAPPARQPGQVSPQPEPGFIDRIRATIADTSKPAGDISDAVIEPGLALGSGLFSLPAAGLGFLGAAGLNATGATDIKLEGLVERIQRALTYQPRTRSGEVGNQVVSYPFEKLYEFGNFLGKKTTEGVVNSGGGEVPAVVAGTAVGTGVQLAPALVLRALGKKTPGQEQQAAARAETAARGYVGNRTGLDYDALAQGTREALNKVASNPKALGELDAAALERQARFESLPVPIQTTAARITRDPVALRNEGNVAATEAGKPIRDVFVDNNAKLIENIQTLQGRRPSRGEVETGRAVQDTARAKLAAKEARVKDLYKKAETAGELQGTAPTRPLARLIKETPDLQHLGWVETWLNKGGIATNAKGAAPKGKRLTASLKELEDLRQAAVARAMNGGTEGYYAGKVIKAIDQATDGVGGSAYKAARKARREQALEFQDQAAVSRLVSDKTLTDRAVALEDTWNDVVLRGSIDDLVKVKRSLLTGGDAATRTAGKNAWRDMRAETIAYIEREATKGVQLLEDGSPNVSPAALKKAVDKIGKDKLDQIFGSGTRKKIDEIVTAARDLKTEPTAVHGGSSTMGNVLAFLERSISGVPGGSVVTGAVRTVGNVKKLGDAGRTVRESQRDPLREAAAKVESRNKLRSLAPFVTAQGDQ